MGVASTETDSTVTSKGQVTLPAPLRRKLGWNRGTRLHFEDCGDGTAVVRAVADAGDRTARVVGTFVPSAGDPATTEDWIALLRGRDEAFPAPDPKPIRKRRT